MAEPASPNLKRLVDEAGRMLSVDEALERILAAVFPLPAERAHISQALGRVPAADIIASRNIPPFRNSAMDGYAVRSEDIAGASAERPVILKIAGMVAAGDVPGATVQIGQAIRIMTGAPVPVGADAVVRFEETDEDSRTRSVSSEASEIGILRPVSPQSNVRLAGEDIVEGALAIRAGISLRPAELGLLAALNISEVDVHRRPLIGILATGNEVVAVDELIQAGQIRDSNSTMLAALAVQAGATPVLMGVARDEIDDLTDKLRRCRRCDFIVTSGGVSIGAYDMVKDVLRTEGAIDVWQVRMRPGKPLAFGRLGSTPLLGLPGNPAAAFVAFTQFATPAIRTMLGMKDVYPETVTARLAESIENTGNRRHYVRAILERPSGDGYTVRATGARGAGMLTSLTRANALIVIPEEIEMAEAGTMVQVQILR